MCCSVIEWVTRRSDSLSSGAEGGGTAQELFGNCAVLGLLGMGAALGLLVRTLLVGLAFMYRGHYVLGANQKN